MLQTRGRAAKSTHRYKYAVRVLRLVVFVAAHDVGKPFNVVHADDVDVVIEAEGLNESEVDLEGDVTLVLLIRGEDAESHAVRVTEGARRES